MARESDMPVEILIKIFRYLIPPIYPYDRGSMFIPLQVCQRWRAVALDQSDFWTQINLSSGKTPRYLSDSESLGQWLKRAQKAPLHIDINGRGLTYINTYVDFNKVVGRILARAPYWKSVSICSDGNEATMFLKLLPRTQFLESLSLDSHVETGFLPSSWVMDQVSNSMMTNLTTLNLRGLTLTRFPKFKAPNLKDLSMAFMTFESRTFDELLAGFPNVQTLVMYHCAELQPPPTLFGPSPAGSPLGFVPVPLPLTPPPAPVPLPPAAEGAPLLPPPTPPPVDPQEDEEGSIADSETTPSILTSLTTLKLRRHYSISFSQAPDSAVHALYAHILDKVPNVEKLVLEICCLMGHNSPLSLGIFQPRTTEFSFQTLEIHIRAPAPSAYTAGGWGDDIYESDSDMYTDRCNWSNETVFNFLPVTDAIKHLIISGPSYKDVRLTPFLEVLTWGNDRGGGYPLAQVQSITLDEVCAEPDEVLELVRARTTRAAASSSDSENPFEFKITLVDCPGLPDIVDANFEELEDRFENMSDVNLPMIY